MKRIYILLLVLAVSLSCLADKYLIYSGDALLGTEEVTVFDNKIITKTTLNASGVQLSYTSNPHSIKWKTQPISGEHQRSGKHHR